MLEYGLPAWCPYTVTLATKLEQIQRRAATMILRQRIGERSYEDRLETLNWMTLDTRRKMHLISFTIKSLYGTVDYNSITMNTSVNTRHLDSLHFHHHYARTLSLKNSPAHLFPRIWSELPEHVRDFLLLDSVGKFAKTLKKSFLVHT